MTTSPTPSTPDLAGILHRLNDATKPVDAADRNLIIRALTARTTGSGPVAHRAVGGECLGQWFDGPACANDYLDAISHGGKVELAFSAAPASPAASVPLDAYRRAGFESDYDTAANPAARVLSDEQVYDYLVGHTDRTHGMRGYHKETIAGGRALLAAFVAGEPK